MPANAQPMAATTKESTTAGPAWSAAAMPVSENKPAPIIAPMPKATRLTGPSVRTRWCLPPSASAMMRSRGLVANRFMICRNNTTVWNAVARPYAHSIRAASVRPGERRNAGAYSSTAPAGNAPLVCFGQPRRVEEPALLGAKLKLMRAGLCCSPLFLNHVRFDKIQSIHRLMQMRRGIFFHGHLHLAPPGIVNVVVPQSKLVYIRGLPYHRSCQFGEIDGTAGRGCTPARTEEKT